MKLVHKSLTPCIFSISVILLHLQVPSIAQDLGKHADIEFYNPERGFKPAQTCLTDVFLQVAGSLEYHGSPEPYIRHMQGEHKRISARFTEMTGKPHKGRLPAHMSEVYLDRFLANWEALSPKLGLDALAREAGRCTREGINGSRGDGTIVIEIFNEHQKLVVEGMKRGSSEGADFARLRAKLEGELELAPNKTEKATGPLSAKQSLIELVERETALSETEKIEYSGLLSLERFTKAEFGALERFYKGAYDKLSDEGKAQISKRVWRGTNQNQTPDTRLDALASAKAFQGKITKLFEKIDAALAPEQAEQVKGMIKSFFMDLCQLAHSEFEIGMLSWSVQDQ